MNATIYATSGSHDGHLPPPSGVHVRDAAGRTRYRGANPKLAAKIARQLGCSERDILEACAKLALRASDG